MSEAKQQKASYLSIFEHTVEDIDVEVNEYVGYLGLDFLNQFKDLSINFENQQIMLTK